jgi:hypothetical protein
MSIIIIISSSINIIIIILTNLTYLTHIIVIIITNSFTSIYIAIGILIIINMMLIFKDKVFMSKLIR